MSPEMIMLVWLISAAVGILVLYFVISAAVSSGMKRFELWKRDGSLEQAMVRHAEKAERREQERRLGM
ncbi:hypothetical protein [Microbacterium sp.]|uniref:hypothetical protein n=1 Tax=Actinomycetes TaxID=1760 RepID=UPI0037CAE56C